MKQPKRPATLLCLLCICLLLPLALTACGSKPTVEQNAVASVTLDEKNHIVVKASLTKGFLESYTEKKIYLFEVPSQYSADVDLDALDPVAELKPRESMTAELSAMDGVRSRLHSSFLIASYDPDTRRYTPVTTPMSLANPEAVADYAAPEEAGEDSLKGLISAYPSDAIRLGISHTVVDVPMERLILAGWTEGAVPYVYNGTTRYLDREALEELDETVSVYTAAGVKVYLRFRLGSPEGKNVPVGLYVTTEGGAQDYAVNMSTAFSAAIMEGFFHFMADRYVAPEDGSRPVSAFLIGYRVNNATEYNCGGGMDLAAYVTNYEKLVRVAHTAVKSHSADGRVYISLDDRRSVTSGRGWDVSTFLSAFRDEVQLRGDYAWHAACELYAATDAVWEENPAADAAYYTVRNLNTLTDLLDSTVYRTAEGEARRLLISGLEIPAVGLGGTASPEAESRQAASYAYAYMTCVQNRRVEALIYSTHTDPAPTAVESRLCGLWRVELDTTMTGSGLDLSLRPSEARPIYDVFARIDTSEAAGLSSALTDIMGASYTKLESALAGLAYPVTVVRGDSELLGYDPEHKKASALYTFGEGSTEGFESAGNLTYLELTEAEALGLITLQARFDRTARCEPMGLAVTLPATELIGGKELLFDLYAGPLASSAAQEKTTVTLRLTRAAKGSVADGDGELLYEASVSDVRASAWQTASFDIRDFSDRLDASDTVILTLLLDYPTQGGESVPLNGVSAHKLGLAGVYVTGNTSASGNNTLAVVLIVVALSLMVAGVFVFVLLRYKRRHPKP